MTSFLTLFFSLGFSARTWTNDLFQLPLLEPLMIESKKMLGLYLCFFVVVLAFFIAKWIIPQAIKFAHRFHLVDHPNFRKEHLTSTPILGGVSIFISVVLH